MPTYSPPACFQTRWIHMTPDGWAIDPQAPAAIKREFKNFMDLLAEDEKNADGDGKKKTVTL